MAACNRCKEELPEQEPGFVTFHICKAGTRSNGKWVPNNERIARNWVEAHTEYDFEEIPEPLQDKLKILAAELLLFTSNMRIVGEVVIEDNEPRELLPWVQKEYDQIRKDMGIE